VTSPSATSTSGPESRIRTSVPRLVDHVAGEYGLDGQRDWSVLATGYEDCNIAMRAGSFGIVIKVFAADRPHWIAERTTDLIVRAQAAGVRHPRLHRDTAGRLVHEYDGHWLLVMDLAPGRTFYDLGRPPGAAELPKVIDQAVRIHSVDAHPAPVFDPWATDNLVPLAGQVGGLLDAEQRHLVDGTVSALAALDWRSLPEALIHADLTAGNVLLGPDSEVTVLDFALANRWPRLQELAVIAASLLYGSADPLPARMSAVAELYSAAAPVPLTAAEWAALDTFGRAGAAMELLGGLAQWQQGNRGAETQALISIGTAGLREYA
jgi:Ser/Thr protein kinase RdoA (MazF antagonist)